MASIEDRLNVMVIASECMLEWQFILCYIIN